VGDQVPDLDDPDSALQVVLRVEEIESETIAEVVS